MAIDWGKESRLKKQFPAVKPVYANGVERYQVLRNGVVVPTPEYTNPLTGLPMRSIEKYPLNQMEVGDYFYLHRTGNAAPEYDNLRVLVHKRAAKLNRKYHVHSPKFPLLIVVRAA